MNPSVSTTTVLRQLSFKLETNIILLGFKSARHFTHVLHESDHKKHTNRCMIPYYIFNQYQYSLVNTTIKSQIVFCYHQQNLYLIINVDPVTPLLFNWPSSQSIEFQQATVSVYDVWNILHHQPHKQFEFSIILYSSYEYKRHQSIKNMKSNMIGIYVSDERNKEILHLLVTPCLKTFQFGLSTIVLPHKTNEFNLKNSLSVPHLSEGTKLIPSDKKSCQKEELLNEDYCICQHPALPIVERKHVREYTSLGKNFY